MFFIFKIKIAINSVNKQEWEHNIVIVYSIDLHHFDIFISVIQGLIPRYLKIFTKKKSTQSNEKMTTKWLFWWIIFFAL